jgi:hypothetical protein
MINSTPAIFFSTSRIHEFNGNVLDIILSDSDSAFQGNNHDEVQENKNNVVIMQY